VERFLEGKRAPAIDPFHWFVELVEWCGPVTVAPLKTRIGFQVRTMFAAVNWLTDQRLNADVVLSRRLENPRFTRIEALSPSSHVHDFRMHSVEALHEEVQTWLCEANAEQVAQGAVAAVHQLGQDHGGYRHSQRESGEILLSTQCGSGQPYPLHSAWLAFRYVGWVLTQGP